MASLWHDVLYQPLLNALFFLYDRFANENLGLAVIELTVLMRIVLLPVSIVSERKRAMLEALSRKVAEVEQQYKGDVVRRRQATRTLLKEHRVNPWAKFIVLGVQVLILVLLYQVFLGGMQAAKLTDLYESVRRPDIVNTLFLGFDIAARNLWWAIAVGVLLFVEIAIGQATRRHTLERRDVFFRYAFPIGAVIVLAQLPMVKSLFILTTMLFSALLFGIRKGVTATS